MLGVDRNKAIPTPPWLKKFYTCRHSGSLIEKQRLCLEAWLRFEELCDQLEFPIENRLQLLGGPGRRSYFRWNRLARERQPFQAPSRAELLCSVIDVFEEVLDGPSPVPASTLLSTKIERVPFKRHSPMALILRADLHTNWELWCVLRFREQGTKMVARLRERHWFF